MVLDHKAKFRISVLSALRVSVVSLSLAGIHHGGTENTEATHPPSLGLRNNDKAMSRIC